MGFLTSFPPYLLSPCSLAAFFRKQKQRRKGSSVSLEIVRREQQVQEENPQEREGEVQLERHQRTVESNGRRQRLFSTGSSWLMHSYNRRIRNLAISASPTQQKQCQPSQLGQFELVPVRNCRFGTKSVPRRNELCQCCPIARSGHRIFVDRDFVYMLGGYNQVLSNDKTYTDAWRFNRLTREWQQCRLADERQPLPNTLASFSLVSLPSGQLSTGSNEALIFGGTGFPFGQEATNQMHRIRIDSDAKIHIQLERNEVDESVELVDENGNIEQPNPPNFPPKMYGHSMAHRMERDEEGRLVETVYLAGGTTGHIYNMDIWRLQRPAQPKNGQWKAKLLNMNGFETGRYRLEAVVHDQTLFTFGGGAPEFCAEFGEILVFNLETRKFELVKTKPDPAFGLPRGRKCHALVQDGKEVYIIGGCRDVQGARGGRPDHQIINDVWRICLDSLQWTRIRTDLPLPVYFHSAALTPDGCIFVFGGCVEEQPNTQTRVNRLQRLWLKPPSLKFLAASALLENMPEWQRQRLAKEGGVRLSDTEALVSRLFEAGLAA